MKASIGLVALAIYIWLLYDIVTRWEFTTLDKLSLFLMIIPWTITADKKKPVNKNLH